jgi:hypothetical protein
MWEKRSKVYAPILIMIISIFLINFTNFSSAVYYETEVFYPSRDAHIYNYYPDNNYGDWEDMYCGNFVGVGFPTGRKNMVYLHFNLITIDPTWESVFLSLTLHGIPKPFDLDIGIVHEYWNENLITWNNRPLNVTFPGKSFDFTTDGTYELNLTDLISYTDSDFSIMLYDQHTEDEVNILISSRENPIQKYRPRLIFYYERQSEIIITNPLSSLSFTKGSTCSIEWITTIDISNVVIELYNNGIFNFQFNETNTGWFNWLIPNDCETGINWQVKISDADDLNVYDWSDYFEIKSVNLLNIPSYPLSSLLLIILGCMVFTIIYFYKKIRLGTAI